MQKARILQIKAPPYQFPETTETPLDWDAIATGLDQYRDAHGDTISFEEFDEVLRQSLGREPDDTERDEATRALCSLCDMEEAPVQLSGPAVGEFPEYKSVLSKLPEHHWTEYDREVHDIVRELYYDVESQDTALATRELLLDYAASFDERETTILDTALHVLKATVECKANHEWQRSVYRVQEWWHAADGELPVELDEEYRAPGEDDVQGGENDEHEDEGDEEGGAQDDSTI
jgi:hypothetical protein